MTHRFQNEIQNKFRNRSEYIIFTLGCRRNEWPRDRIRVNCVASGVIMSDMIKEVSIMLFIFICGIITFAD
jgi:hypothetical protein